MSIFWDEAPKKKTTPKKLLRRMVWDRDKGICQICHRKADPFDWELGHNRARSKGGQLTHKNTFVVHPSCNRSQQTLTLKETRRIIGGPQSMEEKSKQALNALTIGQLKYLAKKRGVKPKSTKKKGFLYDEVKPPGKRQYVNALSKVMTPAKIKADLQKRPKPAKKKKKKPKDDWLF
jgi:hypothetical protein